MAEIAVARAAPLRARLSRDDLIQGAGLVVLALVLAGAVLLPLYAMLSKSFEDADGHFVGFANYVEYFGTPALVTSAPHFEKGRARSTRSVRPSATLPMELLAAVRTRGVPPA